MILIGIVIAITSFLAFIHYIYSYWSRKGFPYLEPRIPSGNLNFNQSFTTLFDELYNKTKEPFVGIYMFYQPTLLVRDPDLVKRILVDDFNSFYDRGLHSNPKTNPMSANLFNLRGKEWKTMRNTLSPAFSSGKLKNIFSSIEEVGDCMIRHLDENVKADGTMMELKDITNRYATDIIISAFFGIEVNSFKDNNHIFNHIRHVMANQGFLQKVAGAALFLAPSVFELFQLYRVNAHINQKMIQIVRETIEMREKTNFERKDLMQLLIQLRNTGTTKEDGNWNAKPDSGTTQTLTIEQIAAQMFLFLVAGLETTASAICFTLYELTQHEDIMAKLLTNIEETLKKHDGKINYDSIADMKYLDLVLMETFRKYPALPFLNRECTKDYKIPGSNFTLEKGTAVVIPMMGLQRDPELFPDPLNFIPERFSEESKNYTPNAYIPFGDGPRICIGLRQGKMSAKNAIVRILTNFKLEAIEKKEIEFQDHTILLLPKDGANIKFTKIIKTK